MRRGTSGVICGRVFLKSTSESHRLGSRRAQFTEERITTPDYHGRVIKSALPNSVVIPIWKKTSVRGGMEEEEEKQQLAIITPPSATVRWWIRLMVFKISGIIAERVVLEFTVASS